MQVKTIVLIVLVGLIALFVLGQTVMKDESEFYLVTFDKNDKEWVILEFGPDCSWGSNEVSTGSGLGSLVEEMTRLEKK